MLPLEVKEFLDSGMTNKWIKVGNLEIYVRKSSRTNPRHRAKYGKFVSCFDIANISCGCKGVGEFSAFLKSLSVLKEFGFEALYVEQVLSNRFANYFRRLGWIETNQCGAIPSFYYFLEY